MDPHAASSSSSTPNHHHNGLHHRFKPVQPVADRIARALRHPLFLLHRSDSSFFVLGATGNVYTVTLSATPSCTCPDRTTPCKHILFVLIRALGVSIDDTCLRRRTLRPCRLSRLLGTPTLPEAMAGVRLRERFHQLFVEAKKQGGLSSGGVKEIEERTVCPVCLEEMEKEEKLLACSTCRNLIHEECLMRWKRSRGRRSASCVICRARWSTVDQDKYLNLATYISQDQAAGGSGDGGGGGRGGLSFCAG
ncbi:Zinc finger, RING-type [Corchorus capsularis]|uniref:Zinc finger, RING-type n=1 Tax=Corchorus capsularis TaxID=210143 RepID=A0A1R3KCZ4_COCAP|nr:Zinc finger, RING-type [Corchorus capsularis]